jgi:hypothetical protein
MHLSSRWKFVLIRSQFLTTNISFAFSLCKHGKCLLILIDTSRICLSAPEKVVWNWGGQCISIVNKKFYIASQQIRESVLIPLSVSHVISLWKCLFTWNSNFMCENSKFHICNKHFHIWNLSIHIKFHMWYMQIPNLHYKPVAHTLKKVTNCQQDVFGTGF